MRLAPRSLFARMTLVVVGGLFVAQVLSTLLLFDERSRWFLQGRITRSSYRLADAIHALDAQPAAQRAGLARGFAAPDFSLAVQTRSADLPATDTALSDAASSLTGELSAKLSTRAAPRVAVRFDPDAPPPQTRPLDPFDTPVPATRIEAVVRSADGQHWYRARWNLPSDNRGLPDRVIWDMALRLGVLLALLLIAVRWVTRPLSVLAQAADRLGRNLDEPPLSEQGPGEVRQAAQAFNQMQQRIRELVRQKAQMLTAVSHDLKTPITRLRLRAEMLDNHKLRGKIARDLDEMEAMVGATLDLMRGDHAVEPLQRTDLLALVESLQADYEDMGQNIGVEAGPVAPVELRPAAMRRCLSNLIDNALNYGQRVVVRVIDAPHQVCVQVEDEGPGLAQADLERVFEPFYRVEASRNRETGGSGLGLSIARAIATEHAGTLSLRNREQGGLIARLELPRR